MGVNPTANFWVVQYESLEGFVVFRAMVSAKSGD